MRLDLHARRRGDRLKLAARSQTWARDAQMTRTELIIQILKVVIGLAFGAYFVCGVYRY
jgi:hypothetical protein